MRALITITLVTLVSIYIGVISLIAQEDQSEKSKPINNKHGTETGSIAVEETTMLTTSPSTDNQGSPQYYGEQSVEKELKDFAVTRLPIDVRLNNRLGYMR